MTNTSHGAEKAKLKTNILKREIINTWRRLNSKKNDQKRTLTPKQAYRNGADWLVIGREITKNKIKKNIQTIIDHLK